MRRQAVNYGVSESRKDQTKTGSVFRVATFNLENYLDATAKKGCAKSPESKAKIRETIWAINPDVIALQEIGSTDTLLELRASLAAEKFDFPHWEYVSGADTDLHVAILSKFPFGARRPHTEDSYTLNGQAFRVRRGFADVVVRVNSRFSFTLFAAHLKSKNENAEAGADALRLEEARLLRDKIEARMKKTPDARILVCGDFNDAKNSRVVRSIAGVGKGRLIDTRPVDKTGKVAWTNYYEDMARHERIDYVLMSPAMAECYLPEKSGLCEISGWRLASDHRPVVAAFAAS
jgi:endonuclease/exonuclease/phosphatase family metal-dependent hydrolase